MTCPRCQNIDDDEIAYLRDERRIANRQAVFDYLRRTYKLGGQNARALVALYDRKPRAVPRIDLLDEIGTETDNLRLINVIMNKVRARLGYDAVLNAWGRGYVIGPAGIDAVEKAIASTAIRDCSQASTEAA